MSEPNEEIQSLAGKGLSDGASLTPEEVQSICGYVLNMSGPPAMSDAVRAELTARRNEYKRRADKRRNEAGFAANVAELDGWVAELDAELA